MVNTRHQVRVDVPLHANLFLGKEVLDLSHTVQKVGDIIAYLSAEGAYTHLDTGALPRARSHPWSVHASQQRRATNVTLPTPSCRKRERWA